MPSQIIRAAVSSLKNRTTFVEVLKRRTATDPGVAIPPEQAKLDLRFLMPVFGFGVAVTSGSGVAADRDQPRASICFSEA